MTDRDSDLVDARFYRLVGARVLAARVERRLTQGELAERAGMTRTSITNLEGGNQRAPFVQLYRLAEALGMSDYRALLPSAEELRDTGAAPLDPAGDADSGHIAPGGPRLLPPAEFLSQWVRAAREAAGESAGAAAGSPSAEPSPGREPDPLREATRSRPQPHPGAASGRRR